MAKISSLRDIPVQIGNRADELLGLDPYANALSEFIKDCDTPITIGIQGDWGIGKTSLLNMIDEYLDQKGKSIYWIVRIETWQYAQFNQEEFLAFSVLNYIIKAVLDKIPVTQRKELEQENRRIFRKILQFGANVLNSYIKEKTDVDIRENMEKTESDIGGSRPDFEDIADDIAKYKEQFIKLVDRICPPDKDRKLVIMIDDLDRIKPIKALELLEVIKNFLDVPKCVFVIAVDYSVIERGAEQKLGKSVKEFYGKSFFDKIIQVPFNMPIASYQTDRYLMSLIGFPYDEEQKVYKTDKSDAKFLSKISYSTLEQEHASFFTNVTKLTAGQNPRTIKRIVNYANLIKMITVQSRLSKDAKEGNKRSWDLATAKVVYAISCLQLSWPEIFEYFAANPSPAILERMEDMNFIATIPGSKKLFDRYMDGEEIQSKISGFFDEFITIIDKDANGDISAEEFKLVWDVLKDANLTNAELENINENWKDFEKVVLRHSNGSKNWTESKVALILDLFRNTRWNDRLNFRLLKAGSRFCNLTWNQKHIGSIVSTRQVPIQLYLNHDVVPIETLSEQLSEKQISFVTEYQGSHIGYGDIRIDLERLADDSDRAQTMDRLLDLIVQSLNKSKKRA